MTNDFKTGEQIARIAAQIASADLGLANLVYRDVAADYRQGYGNVVQIRVPGVTTTSTRPVGSTANYETGALAEKAIPVTLDVEAYSVVGLSLADTSLNLEDYSRQVIRPQAQSVAQHIDAAVAAVMAATTPTAGITYDATKPASAFVKARSTIRRNGASAGRALQAVVGVNVFADLLIAEALDDKGAVAGIPVAESTMVDADALYVFVPEAFVAAIRAPEVPDGLAMAASVSEGGIALAHMQGFNAANGATNSIVTAFIGVAAMPLPVADFSTGEVTLVAGGGIVSVTTAA